jgi:hypothetical protein
MDNNQFIVGDKYINRKGLFEVISIKDDSMTIQWDNGEKISTTIKFQQSIIEGMERERQERIRLELKDKINLNKTSKKNRKALELI